MMWGVFFLASFWALLKKQKGILKKTHPYDCVFFGLEGKPPGFCLCFIARLQVTCTAQGLKQTNPKKILDDLIWFLGDCGLLLHANHMVISSWEGSPTQIDYRIKGTLILTSRLEDLANGFRAGGRVDKW